MYARMRRRHPTLIHIVRAFNTTQYRRIFAGGDWRRHDLKPDGCEQIDLMRLPFGDIVAVRVPLHTAAISMCACAYNSQALHRPVLDLRTRAVCPSADDRGWPGSFPP